MAGQAAARAAERRAADEKWCASAGAHDAAEVEDVPGAASGALQVWHPPFACTSAGVSDCCHSHPWLCLRILRYRSLSAIYVLQMLSEKLTLSRNYAF